MQFKWDEAKRRANFIKHGVDFADAVGVFFDERALTREDPDAAGEQRFVTLGMDFLARVLIVVHAEREGEVIRLISARSPGERKHYGG